MIKQLDKEITKWGKTAGETCPGTAGGPGGWRAEGWAELSGTARRGRILSDFLSDEEGVGVIEIVLILVVLIGLVIIFKNQINTLLDNIFKQIESLSESVY